MRFRNVKSSARIRADPVLTTSGGIAATVRVWLWAPIGSNKSVQILSCGIEARPLLVVEPPAGGVHTFGVLCTQGDVGTSALPFADRLGRTTDPVGELNLRVPQCGTQRGDLEPGPLDSRHLSAFSPPL